MKILLDTHIIIWLETDPNKLSKDLLNILENRNTEVYYSLVSIWELAIKAGLGRISIDLPSLMEKLRKNSIEQLAIKESHILKVKELPLLHKDPFDRLLVSQAIMENLGFLTRDKIIHKYSKKLVKLV